MKELIFKGVRKDNGQEVIFNLIEAIRVGCYVGKEYYDFLQCDPDTVRQYINFDDCDGDGIFDGDQVILTCEIDGEIFRDKYQVFYDYTLLGWMLINCINPKEITGLDGIDQDDVILARKLEKINDTPSG